MTETEDSIKPQRALVTPRGFRAGSQAHLPLEQLIRPFVHKDARGAIFIVGAAGSGKTTALAHLLAVFSTAGPVACFDEPEDNHWLNFTRRGLAIVSISGDSPLQAQLVLNLAGWNDDDCIEYLAQAHRDKCASVMVRLKSDPSLENLKSSPALLRMAMDRMASDDSLNDLSEALRKRLWEVLPEGPPRVLAANVCLAALMNARLANPSQFPNNIPTQAVSLLRHRVMQTLLTAWSIAEQLNRRGRPVFLHSMLDRPTVIEIGRAVRPLPSAVFQLQKLLRSSDRRPDAMAASILLANDPNWRPKKARDLRLNRAILRNAQWNGLDLTAAWLNQADLTGANLDHAKLDNVEAREATFTNASLQHGSLKAAALQQTDFTNADLQHALLIGADLFGANFENTRLMHAHLKDARLSGTNFRGAKLAHADLYNAMIFDIDIEDADFSHANLKCTAMTGVKMNLATWTHASFYGAGFEKCDLSGLDLPQADFTLANLTGSDLTGTRIPGGKFKGAKLRGAGLADIDWENADLRDADFTHASFHMGSSRSGLVGSVIPCEGSKTGFYTDEFNEQDFKAPEEIRKANLRGANLLGANVTGTDWYLVDLRDASYSEEQADHFARCGAILATKVR